MNRKLILVLSAFALALYFIQLPLFWGYLTDDTYIYAQFARNLAVHGEFTFNLGERVHAATSPLWAGLGAMGVAWGFDAFWTLKYLAWACGALALVLFVRVCVRCLPGGIWPWLAVAAAATEPWFVRWSGSGMETAFAVLLLVSVMDLGMRPAARVRWWGLGFLLGLAPLVRPEFLLLTGLVAVAAAWRPGWRAAWPLWAGVAIVFVAWAAFAQSYYGSVLPATLQAKSTPMGWVPARLFANVKTMALQLGIAALIPCLTAVFFFRPRRWWEGEADAWISTSLWAWVVLLPLVYLARDVTVVSRYLESILPAVILLSARAVSREGRAWWRWAWAAQIAFALVFTVGTVAPSTRAYSRSADIAMHDISNWLRDNTPPDAIVAVYDIGIIGYRSGRRILDLGGLVQPGINDLRNSVGDDEILRQGLFLRFGTPDYLVHRDAERHALDGFRLGDKTARHLFWRRVDNLGLTRPESVVYTLYVLE